MKLIENFDSLRETQALAYLICVLAPVMNRGRGVRGYVWEASRLFEKLYGGSYNYEQDCASARKSIDKMKRLVELL